MQRACQKKKKRNNIIISHSSSYITLFFKLSIIKLSFDSLILISFVGILIQNIHALISVGIDNFSVLLDT